MKREQANKHKVNTKGQPERRRIIIIIMIRKEKE